MMYHFLERPRYAYGTSLVPKSHNLLLWRLCVKCTQRRHTYILLCYRNSKQCDEIMAAIVHSIIPCQMRYHDVPHFGTAEVRLRYAVGSKVSQLAIVETSC